MSVLKKIKSCEINAKHLNDKCAITPVKEVCIFYSNVIFNNEQLNKQTNKKPWAVAMLHG